MSRLDIILGFHSLHIFFEELELGRQKCIIGVWIISVSELASESTIADDIELWPRTQSSFRLSFSFQKTKTPDLLNRPNRAMSQKSS